MFHGRHLTHSIFIYCLFSAVITYSALMKAGDGRPPRWMAPVCPIPLSQKLFSFLIMESLFSLWVKSNSFETLWRVAHNDLLSIRFPRQEYWSRLPFPSPDNLPNPGMEPASPALQAGSYPWTSREDFMELGRHRFYCTLHPSFLIHPLQLKIGSCQQYPPCPVC